MANTAFEHSPTITVPGSGNSTDNAVVLWNGTTGNNFSNSTIIVGATTMGLAADTDLLTFGNGTLAITGAVTGVTTLAASTSITTPSVLLSGSSNTLTLDVAAVTAAYTIILPDAVPGATGKILQTSGSDPWSTLVWADAATIVPTTIAVLDTTDSTTFVGLWTDAAGDLAPKTDAALTYDASNGALTAVTFHGSGASLTNLPAGGIASVAADTTPQVGGSAGFDLQAQLLVGNGGTTGIAVSSAGAVTMAAQPTVSLHHSASQTVAESTTTPIAFDTENWKVGDSTQHDNSSNNSRLYARTAGKYMCAGTVSYSNNNGGWRYMEIAVNGSEKAFDTRQAVQGNRTRVNMSYLADLAAGDYVEFRAYQTGSGATLNIERTGNEPNFWFIKVA